MKQIICIWATAALLTCAVAVKGAHKDNISVTVGDLVVVTMFTPILLPMLIWGKVDDLLKIKI